MRSSTRSLAVDEYDGMAFNREPIGFMELRPALPTIMEWAPIGPRASSCA